MVRIKPRSLLTNAGRLGRYLRLLFSATVRVENARFAEFVKAHLDPEAYLETYPDVRAAGIDPVSHWLEHGMAEGRRFFPDTTFLHGIQAKQATDAQWLRFAWQGIPVAVRLNTTPEDPQSTDRQFVEFVKSNLDRDAYLDAYQDVKAAGIDPVNHWLEHGMVEGRFLYPGATVVSGDIANQFDNTLWQRFTWRGRSVAVRIMKPVTAPLIAQIVAQARHDPGVLAAGVSALGGLRQLDGPDLLGRDGVDPRSIFAAIPERPDVIVVVPFLREGNAEKYASDLVGSLAALGHGKILVIVTDDTAETASGWESLAILAPLTTTQVVFWPDICGPSFREPKYFARLVNALRPPRLVVINSRIGLDVTAGFGRGLSKLTKLYCVYFGRDSHEDGSLAAARYAYRTLPYSLAVTDNIEVATTLRRLWGELPGPGIAVLPPRLQSAGGTDVHLENVAGIFGAPLNNV